MLGTAKVSVLELVQGADRRRLPASPDATAGRRRTPASTTARAPAQETTMADHDDDDNEPVPFMQKLLDNPFLLLFLGVLIPMLVYNLWGVIDILTIPVSK
jgi:hypothetical protein